MRAITLIFFAILWILCADSSMAKVQYSEINLPKHSDFFVKRKPIAHPKLNFEPYVLTVQVQEILEDGLRKGPNFAGHYSIILEDCGNLCKTVWIINLKTGKIISHQLKTQLMPSFKVNSKLLILNSPEYLGKTACDLAKLKASAKMDVRFLVVENDAIRPIYSLPLLKLLSKCIK